jgi:hypothetical protein
MMTSDLHGTPAPSPSRRTNESNVDEVSHEVFDEFSQEDSANLENGGLFEDIRAE